MYGALVYMFVFWALASLDGVVCLGWDVCAGWDYLSFFPLHTFLASVLYTCTCIYFRIHDQSM